MNLQCAEQVQLLGTSLPMGNQIGTMNRQCIEQMQLYG